MSSSNPASGQPRLTKLHLAGHRLLALHRGGMLPAGATEHIHLLDADPSGERSVRVLIRFKGNIDALKAHGFQPTSLAGDVAAGQIRLIDVPALHALPQVVAMEFSQRLVPTLDISAPNIKAPQVWASDPPNQGAGVVVGIIDDGLDYLHPNFRTALNGSRILFLWDQGLVADPSLREAPPAGFPYGVEYTAEDINTNIDAGKRRLRTRPEQHGTKVTGIAAGNGDAPDLAGTSYRFVGIAPEASIIFVKYEVGERRAGYSAHICDAISYIFARAESLGMPAVINLSLGDDFGQHDGSELLERFIDLSLFDNGKFIKRRSIVTSAGNAAADGRHVTAPLVENSDRQLTFDVPANTPGPIVVSIWYGDPDHPTDTSMSVTLLPPGGKAGLGPVGPNDEQEGLLGNNNAAVVRSAQDNPNNHRNQFLIEINEGLLAHIVAGRWTLKLTGLSVPRGAECNAWINRGPGARFVSPSPTQSRTITIPGNARLVLTVGAYVTRGVSPGSLCNFSSRGPSLADVVKPEITAPGQAIISTQITEPGQSFYNQAAPGSGTSYAAPHATGTVALMFAQNPELTQKDIRDIVARTARRDADTGNQLPNNDWGHGKLDAAAAVQLAREMAETVG